MKLLKLFISFLPLLIKIPINPFDPNPSISIIGPVTSIGTLTMEGFQVIEMPSISKNRTTPIYVSLKGAGLTFESKLKIEVKKPSSTSYELFVEDIFSSVNLVKIYSFQNANIEFGTYSFLFSYFGQDRDDSVTLSVNSSARELISYDVSKSQMQSNKMIYTYNKNGGTSSRNETFSLSGFEDSIYQKTYKRINFDSLCLKLLDSITGVDSYSKITGYLMIADNENLFSNIGVKSGKNRKLDLAINKQSLFNACNFSFKNTYYVDPKTHEMSNEKLPGYLPTKYFYLPINKFSSLKELSLVFNFAGVGLTDFSLTLNCVMKFEKNYFGDCFNSEYCITEVDSEV